MVRRARLLVVVALGMAGLALPATPAGAHTGDGLARPVFERLQPAVPGVKVDVAYSATYQLIVENPTPTELTLLADTGEPFLRIGPEGVFGNFKSPTWYGSNVPLGLSKFPPQAEPGADVPPRWSRVSVQPTWGWYDHRLHPVERYLDKEVLASTKMVELGKWSVPLTYGGSRGAITGRFEYKPTLGQYNTQQTSPTTPAEGVKVQVVPARSVPAVFVENLSPEPVVILGRQDEPFARIGPKITEVNLLSPMWIENQQARGQDPTEPADPQAEPKWHKVADAPRWTWLEFRAASPKEDPPKAVAQRDTATTVKTWKVPYLIGDRRHELLGGVQFVPVAQARNAATGGAGAADGRGSSRAPLFAGIGLAAVAVAVLALRTKKKVAPPPVAQERHRSRATPKIKH